jgi:hypothetical protein
VVVIIGLAAPSQQTCAQYGHMDRAHIVGPKIPHALKGNTCLVGQAVRLTH